MTKSRKAVFAAAVSAIISGAVLVAAGSIAVPAQAAGAGGSGGGSTMDKMFVRKAAQDNLAEVMVGKLALQKSHNKDILAFANKIVADHSKANDALKQVAKKQGYAVPTAPDAKQKALYNRLSKLSGTAFDKAYARAMAEDHDKAVKLFEKEMNTGKDSAVRDFAAQYLTAIQNHDKMIHTIAWGMKHANMKHAKKMH